MFRSIATIASLLLATAILYAGNGLQNTLLAVRGDLEGFPTAVIGALTSAYFAGFILGCRFVPGTIKTVGHIRAFVALASVASSSALAHLLVVDATAWAVLRFITGFSFAGLTMVLESWINERATNENRGKILSIYRMVDLGAVTLGNALLATASPSGFHLFVLVSILISVALVPVALTRIDSPAPLETARLDIGELYRTSPVGAVGAAATGLANAAFWGVAPVFVQKVGYAPAMVAAFMSTSIIGAGVFQFPMGWLSDRIDRRLVIIGSSAMGAGAAILLAMLAGVSSGALLGLAFLFGGLIIPTFGICAAHANDHAAPGKAVATSGGLLLLHGVGSTVGAMAGAVAMSLFHPAALFIYIAVIYLVLAAFAFVRMNARAAADIKRPYIPLAKSPLTRVYRKLVHPGRKEETPAAEQA
ncbi:MFS transporter [Henriciella aquimarina]|uniref:MFS transporter n=1 Tax=Henriciella aquimarina TaxID=545261 RepID=UPI0009FF61E6|nr:MFS transporter [Henriciella aquimarina]